MSIVENPYATPRAPLSWLPARTPVFFVVSPRKFVFMVLLTLGGYFAYWLHRQWSQYRQVTGASLWVWPRVLFPACYFCSLILSVRAELECGESAYRWWPRSLAVAIFLGGCLPFTVLWLLSPPVALGVAAAMAGLQLVVAVQVQGAINHLEAGDGNGFTGFAKTPHTRETTHSPSNTPAPPTPHPESGPP